MTTDAALSVGQPHDSAGEPVRLGRTDLRVGPVGVGAMTWGDAWGGMYGGGYHADDTRAAFETCRGAGSTLFDTAEMYSFGQAERVLGAYLHAAAGDGASPAATAPVVATKIMPFPWRLGPGSLGRALAGSLRRLGLAHVDLYQMHAPGGPVAIERWMDSMADAVEAGLVRAVGVSNYSAEQMGRAHAALARRGIPLATNQVQYSLLHRAPERNGVLAACRELGVTLIAYMPLHMGMLTGKYTPEHPPRGLLRRLSGEGRRGRLVRAQPLIAQLREIGAAHGGRTPSQVALNWIVRQGAVPIAGVRDARQAQALAGVADWSPSAAEMAALDETSSRL